MKQKEFENPEEYKLHLLKTLREKYEKLKHYKESYINVPDRCIRID